MPRTSSYYLALLATIIVAAIPRLADCQTSAMSGDVPAAGVSVPSSERTKKDNQLRELTQAIERRLGKGARYVNYLTPESSLVNYVDMYKKEIEKIGTAKFPKVDGKSVYGSVTVCLTIDSMGRVEQADPIEGEKNSLLAYSRKLLAGLPKMPFPSTFPKGTRRIAFVTTFNYAQR